MLYSGRLGKEKDYAYGNTIRILDWNVLKSIELHTDIDLKRIVVSKDDQYIYGIGKDKEEYPCIVSFFIGNIIENLI